MKAIYSISGLIAIITMILAVIARLFLPNKSLFGMSALSYLRVTNTMLFFTIAGMIFEYFHRGKKE